MLVLTGQAGLAVARRAPRVHAGVSPQPLLHGDHSKEGGPMSRHSSVAGLNVAQERDRGPAGAAGGGRRPPRPKPSMRATRRPPTAGAAAQSGVAAWARWPGSGCGEVEAARLGLPAFS